MHIDKKREEWSSEPNALTLVHIVVKWSIVSDFKQDDI